MLNKLKNSIYLLLLLLLNNCMTSGTALLGPIFTGAKTGSIYQASLSYGSGKIMKKINVSSIASLLLELKETEVLQEGDTFVLITKDRNIGKATGQDTIIESQLEALYNEHKVFVQMFWVDKLITNKVITMLKEINMAETKLNKGLTIK